MPDEPAPIERLPAGRSTVFELAPGVRLEPFPDGSALLLSEESEESLSLNLTGALLCTFADGTHSLDDAHREVQGAFQGSEVAIQVLAEFLLELADRGLLLLNPR